MITQSRCSSHLAQAITVLLLIGGLPSFAETPQAHVHDMAHGVMPFDMARTVHIFRMTESGGVQSVIAKDPADTAQIALIRQHLQHETALFQAGNYADPAMLHGESMPGLKEVQAGAARIKVSYAELPSGAAITFETTDVHLLTAIHRWFGAQLSEHGADAKAE